MDKKCFDNRELSWLKFNKRVLEEAQDESVPLLERLTFSAIYQSNLDEFFMVRVGSLYDTMLVDDEYRENKTGMTAEEQLQKIFKKVKELGELNDTIYKDICSKLKKKDLTKCDFKSLHSDEEKYLAKYFDAEIMPLLSPLIVDKRHPFPFMRNKQIYAAVQLEAKSGIKIGLLPIDDAFQRVIFLNSEKTRFILLEDIVLHYSPKVFENYNVVDKTLVRVTRNADISEEEALIDHDRDFRSVMEELVKRRKKLAPVRLQLQRSFNKEALEYLMEKLEIKSNQVFYTKAPLDLSFVFKLTSLPGSEGLKFNKLVPQKSPYIDERKSMISQIEASDLFLTYPYESIKPFIRLLNEAASDPNVVSIKITLYRLAKNSQVIQALVDAVENGKNVLVLVELRARFDEENNIGWSRRLEDVGCTVIYGPKNLKVHSKLLLITRKIGDRIEYITQVGTGNYNEKTSTIYTDYSLMTVHNDIGQESLSLFNALSMGNLVEETNHLLIAPLCLQSKIIEMIDIEIDKAKNNQGGYIGFKVNSVSDKTIINKLIEASQAGVKIELLVRGICCLIAGVEGYTENISVTSIVGRYLEHSRIYIFGKNNDMKLYISSADIMTRNTIRRVEVAAPIYDDAIRNRIHEMFKTMLADNVKARIQQNSGEYKRQERIGVDLNSQIHFYNNSYRAVENIKNKDNDNKRGVIKKIILKIRKRIK